MRKKTLRSPKLQRKTRQKKMHKMVLLSTFLFVSLVALVYALFRPEFRIRDIQIDGGEAVPRESIATFLRSGMEGSYLGVIPKKHILFYPKNRLTASTLNAFPTLSNVDISRGGISRVHVSAVSRNPHVSWCEDGQCFFMDDTGFVFSEATEGSESLYYRFVSEQIATTTPIGSNRLEPEHLSQLFSALVRLETFGLETKELRFKENGEYEVVLRGGARLLLGVHEFDKALNRLETLLGEKGLVPRQGIGGLGIDYIDLRYGNKIYFK